MKNELIQIEQLKNIFSITLNRPEKRNALNGQLISELKQTLEYIAEAKNVRVVIIQGNGTNFCAGGDIYWMQEMAKASYEDNYADAKLLADCLYQLYSLPMPTIALAHGATMGGGLGLLCACDIVIASRNTNFAFSEVKIGIAPSTISPYVIAAIGERAAHYYFLTGESFQAEEAKRIGLVHIVTEEADLLRTGVRLAKQLLKNGPNALIEIKSLLRQVSKEKISISLGKLTAEHLANVRLSPEAEEGLKAFVEKRDPEWR